MSRPSYLLSLPVRVLRSASALAGGLVREVGEVVLPGALRRTRLYQNLVDVTLRFLIEKVGQVEGTYPDSDQLADDFLLRRAAGNGVDIVGLLAFHASPVWVLAALADLSGAGKRLLGEIAETLCEAGLLERGQRFENMEQILAGLEQTSARVVETVSTPPLNVASLRKEWAAIRHEAAQIPPRDLPGIDDVTQAWNRMRETAAVQQRSVFEVSSLMALSAMSTLAKLPKAALSASGRTRAFLSRTILDHYAETLDEIQTQGFTAYWRAQFRPYLTAAARHFQR